ncbi:alpha/beta fold hydrolase [Mycobacterium sp. 48b]|uniref:alpha/beta fold hydrolase n=1 Tax=Mycobacterium sp. 48b TaxID=3400426 RepID=UPI003AB0A0A0
MPTFETADRTDIRYTDTGSGPVLVFTHSWGLNSGQWDQVIERLVDNGFRCVSYDRRGHDGSGPFDGEWTADLLADDLAALFDHLDLGDATLVGHSLGCGEIVRYLSRHGAGRVDRAVLVAPQLPMVVRTEDNPDGVDEAILEGMTAALEHDVRQWCVDNAAPFFGDHQVPPEVVEWTMDQVADLPVATLVATQQMGAHTDYRAELAELDLPVLVIQGDADASTPIELTGRRTVALLPRGTLIEIPGAAHGLYLTHADRIIDAISVQSPALTAAECAEIAG